MLIHIRYLEHFLRAEYPNHLALARFRSLESLCEEVLRHFSRKNIRASINASSSRPVESSFQVEFYRAFTCLVGHGAGLSSEWSYTSEGRVDFWVHDLGWGVEILRDGDRLRNHCNRFRRSGQYGDWIKKGVLKDWIIIDCRHTWPKKYGIATKHTAVPHSLQRNANIPHLDVPGTKLWRVMFKDDYSFAVVLDRTNNTKISEFTLFD